MGKRPKLAAALREFNQPAEPSATPAPPHERGRGSQPPGRTGMKQIGGYFDPAVARQLKQLALDRETTVQGLLREALNDLFTKHRQKPLA
jgi:hypothetical protein